MAITRVLLPEQTTADFRKKGVGWLQRAKEQKVLAKEMVKRTHQMRDRAAEMRRAPNLVALS